MRNTMHSFENSSNVPAFLIKLWKLVEDPKCDELIAWSDSGFSFIIKDQARFAKELLPLYFKHNNMASFIRQLNMYGFKKVMNIEKSGLRNENDEMEFQNMFFIKEKSELLELIKRKIPNTRVVAESPSKSNAKEILIDLTSIREKQDNVDSMLLKMKAENELLWRELHSMRQKHKAQEQIIQKVIHFLVSIVQRSNQNIGVQKKLSRMIHNSPSKASSSQVSRTINVVRNNNSDCIIVPEGVVSPLGPVIHEVIEGEESPSSTSLLGMHLLEGQDASGGSKSPIVNNPISPETTEESINILEALTPKAASSELNSSTKDGESILRIPLDYITETDENNVNVLSIPENSEICNTISIPESNVIVKNEVDNVIFLPECTVIDGEVGNVISISEDGSVKNVSSLDGVDSNIGSVVSITSCDSVAPENKSVENDSQNPSKTVSDSDFLAETENMDYSFDISDLDFPTTSYSMPRDDYEEHASLNTPKIVISDDETLSSFSKDKVKSSKTSGQLIPKKNITHNEHNYQMPSDSAVAKNLSSHLHSVDEKLNFTQDKLSTSPWNLDFQSLLGVCGLQNYWSSLEPQLFSSDEILSCESFANSLSDEMNIKTDPNDITGNELVQFMPPLFPTLSDQPEISSQDHPIDLSTFDQSVGLQSDAITPADEDAASQAVDFLTKAIMEGSNQAKHKKSNVPKGKRRKIK